MRKRIVLLAANICLVTSVGASAGPTPLYTLSDVKGEVLTVPGEGGKKYVRVEFTATAKSKPAKGTLIVTKYSCKVKDQTLVQKSRAFGMKLDELDAGESAKGSTSAWVLQPLEAGPSQCNISFGTEVGFGSEPNMNLGTYCFVPPSTVSSGMCQTK